MAAREDDIRAVATALYVVKQMGVDGSDGADEFQLTTAMLRDLAMFSVRVGGYVLSPEDMEVALSSCAVKLVEEQFQQAHKKGEVH